MANQKYKIKGNKRIPDYDSELEIEVDDKYEAYSKDIPADTPYEGGYIKWFNSFGVREKLTGRTADVPYNVTLQAIPEGKRLFVFYGGEPHEIIPKDSGNGKVKFPLSVGDPPTGQFP